MTYSYQCWADFGAEGIPATDVSIDYQAARDYSLSSVTTEAVTEIWDAMSAADEELFDSPCFNLRGVSDTRLHLGPTRFRDHRVRRALLADDDRVPQTYPESVTSELRDAVHLLSSFVAVVADGRLCLGIKPDEPDNPPFLSLPGSGYLDRDADMTGESVASTEQVIGRELREELGLEIADTSVRCYGVFEDTHPNSHLNPALFSVIESEQVPDVVRERARMAPDRDEFTEFAFVPLKGPVLSALVARALPSEAEGSLPGSLPFDDVPRLSHKTLLMLLLLGRDHEGIAWFEDLWTQFDACTFETTLE